MTEIRFHREIYRGTAVDEAVKVFGRFATFSLTEEPQHWVVQLTAKTASREQQIVGEVCNYALGLTVKERQSST